MEFNLKNVHFNLRKEHLVILIKTFIFLCCITTFSFTSNRVLSQNAKITIKSNATITVDDVFNLIMNQTNYKFIYQEGIFKNFPKVRVEKGVISANDLLQKSLKGGNLIVELSANNTVIVKENKATTLSTQGIKISGTVFDKNNMPLAGANILEKGTTNGTQTDFDGNFTLNVASNNAVLIVSYLGFLSQEVKANKSPLNIILEEDSAKLDEVVVVGYGTVKKSDLTGSVSSVKGDVLKEFPVASVDQALQARASGIQVTQSSSAPGGGLTVRIRGSNSINAGSEPLYVIDGFPIYPDNAAIGTGGNRQPTNALASLNPNDIDSIEVLKDASATSIYGSRGSNGVVLITTKRGKEGNLKINFDSSFSIQNIARSIEMLNASEFRQYLNQNLVNSGAQAPYTAEQIKEAGIGTNWMNEITKTGGISNQQISFTGGNTTSRYAFITNYFDNKGIILNTDFKRYGFRLNLDNDFFNGKATLNNSWSYNRSSSSNVPTDRSGPGGEIMIGLGLDPSAAPYNSTGDYNYPSYDQRFNINPIAEAKEGYDRDFTNRLFGTTAITVRLMDNLQFRTSVGADVINSERTTFYNN